MPSPEAPPLKRRKTAEVSLKLSISLCVCLCVCPCLCLYLGLTPAVSQPRLEVILPVVAASSEEAKLAGPSQGATQAATQEYTLPEEDGEPAIGDSSTEKLDMEEECSHDCGYMVDSGYMVVAVVCSHVPKCVSATWP